MKIERLFASYQEYHHNGANKVYHYLGIPLIVFGLLNLFYQIPHFHLFGLPVDFALLFCVAVLVYYLTLDVALALGIGLLTAPIYLASILSRWEVGLGGFVLGWIFQLVGHQHEGKKPAFFSNAVHFLIGPLWITSLLLQKLGLRRPR